MCLCVCDYIFVVHTHSAAPNQTPPPPTRAAMPLGGRLHTLLKRIGLGLPTNRLLVTCLCLIQRGLVGEELSSLLNTTHSL